MSSDVPYLKKEVIESEAALILAEYGREHGQITAPPIPVDEIVELHLKLQLRTLPLKAPNPSPHRGEGSKDPTPPTLLPGKR